MKLSTRTLSLLAVLLPALAGCGANSGSQADAPAASGGAGSPAAATLTQFTSCAGENEDVLGDCLEECRELEDPGEQRACVEGCHKAFEEQDRACLPRAAARNDCADCLHDCRESYYECIDDCRNAEPWDLDCYDDCDSDCGEQCEEECS